MILLENIRDSMIFVSLYLTSSRHSSDLIFSFLSSRVSLFFSVCSSYSKLRSLSLSSVVLLFSILRSSSSSLILSFSLTSLPSNSSRSFLSCFLICSCIGYKFFLTCELIRFVLSYSMKFGTILTMLAFPFRLK